MIRDTLEMVPVALVLAVVLSFGLRPANAPLSGAFRTAMASGTLVAGSASLMPQPATGATQASDAASQDGRREAIVLIAEPGPGTTVAANRTASSSPRREFLPRRSHVTGVPFYTAADLATNSASTMARATSSSPASPPSEAAASTAASSPRYDARSAAPALATPERKRISINRADVESLVRIPGIGRSRAELIIGQRPLRGYTTWSQIDDLPGFGPGTLGMLMQHAVLD